jgi:flagellar biosynthesis/type III secretory pathway protein FliH
LKFKTRSIIPADKAKRLQPAQFRSFEQRPVNYFRDMFTDDGADGASRLNEDEFNSRMEAMLGEERERARASFDAEAKRQYQAGLEKGRTESTGEIRRGMELLEQYSRVLQAEKKEVADRTEKSAVELAFALAKRILGRELSTRPELVVDVARNALNQVLDCERVRLKVNPEDLVYLKNVEAEFESLLGKRAQLELGSDREIARGGCLLETERGILDARISSQLDALHASMETNVVVKV